MHFLGFLIPHLYIIIATGNPNDLLMLHSHRRYFLHLFAFIVIQLKSAQEIIGSDWRLNEPMVFETPRNSLLSYIFEGAFQKFLFCFCTSLIQPVLFGIWCLQFYFTLDIQLLFFFLPEIFIYLQNSSFFCLMLFFPL